MLLPCSSRWMQRSCMDGLGQGCWHIAQTFRGARAHRTRMVKGEKPVWKDQHGPAMLLSTAPCYCTQPGHALS